MDIYYSLLPSEIIFWLSAISLIVLLLARELIEPQVEYDKRAQKWMKMINTGAIALFIIFLLSILYRIVTIYSTF